MGRQVRGKYVYRLVGSLVDRQVDRHTRIYKASFEPAEGRLQKLVSLNNPFSFFKSSLITYTSFWSRPSAGSKLAL